jgi:hypothetical protein
LVADRVRFFVVFHAAQLTGKRVSTWRLRAVKRAADVSVSALGGGVRGGWGGEGVVDELLEAVRVFVAWGGFHAAGDIHAVWVDALDGGGDVFRG